MAKTIITAALTGAVTPAGYHIPETPEQIVQAAYECWQLGAAVVHIHTRAADGKGAMNTQAFREIVEGIRAHKDCDVIINCTSSGASPEHPATDEERFLHHMTVPGIEMGSYDAGSFNWMPGGVFVNSPQFLQKLGDAYLEKGIKPEIEIFDAGMLGIADYFVKKGHLSTPCHYQFCLGVLGGMPATVENLIYLKDRIPTGSTWSAFGIGAAHLPILYAALALGGHIRVGMEDNVIFGKDENGKKIMATNQMLVQRAVEAVTLYDINDQQLAKSHDQMLRSLDALVAHNAITAARKDEIIACVRPTTSMEEAVQDAQFIQESGPERIEIKRSILAQVEQYAAPDALYASSTSGLLISDIVAEALHPERCIGAHPYNPPHLIPLVELTRCDKTDDDCVQLAYDFYQSIGKEAVLLRKECPGFIANRLQLALYREVQDLVMRGVCSVEDVDKALVYGPGIRWAIFGHNMIMQMGNPGGLTGMVEMLGNSGDRWLEDMASWTHQPDNWAQVAQPGVNQEMANFPDYIGHTNAECIAYRDQMLIDILKLHKKL